MIFIHPGLKIFIPRVVRIFNKHVVGKQISDHDRMFLIKKYFIIIYSYSVLMQGLHTQEPYMGMRMILNY